MMAKTETTNQVVSTMEKTGMIPVFYHADFEVAKAVLDCSYKAGVRVFEFTNRGANAFEVFVRLLSHAKKYSDMYLGIGTIMDDETTKKFIEAGAHFIVSPILKPSMAAVCQNNKVPWIPGCATLTEIVNAREAGAVLIKVFPGSVLGPGFVSSVLPVVPGLKLMPTGGVEPTEENLQSWFKSGVVCVGMGSQLFKKDLIEKKEWTQLEKQIAVTMDLIRRIRN